MRAGQCQPAGPRPCTEVPSLEDSFPGAGPGVARLLPARTAIGFRGWEVVGHAVGFRTTDRATSQTTRGALVGRPLGQRSDPSRMSSGLPLGVRVDVEVVDLP